jgi:hypothetical protein
VIPSSRRDVVSAPRAAKRLRARDRRGRFGETNPFGKMPMDTWIRCAALTPPQQDAGVGAFDRTPKAGRGLATTTLCQDRWFWQNNFQRKSEQIQCVAGTINFSSNRPVPYDATPRYRKAILAKRTNMRKSSIFNALIGSAFTRRAAVAASAKQTHRFGSHGGGATPRGHSCKIPKRINTKKSNTFNALTRPAFAWRGHRRCGETKPPHPRS